jgi:hypothetical protein
MKSNIFTIEIYCFDKIIHWRKYQLSIDQDINSFAFGIFTAFRILDMNPTGYKVIED